MRYGSNIILIIYHFFNLLISCYSSISHSIESYGLPNTSETYANTASKETAGSDGESGEREMCETGENVEGDTMAVCIQTCKIRFN